MATRKKEKKFDWASIPFINYVNVMEEQEADELIHLMKEVEHAAAAEGQVEFHRDRLGEQKLCFQGDGRFWVWEDRDWRVFASNKLNRISVEVRAGLPPKRAWNAFEDYRRAVGLVR